MFCNNCGMEIAEDSTVCVNCDTVVAEKPSGNKFFVIGLVAAIAFLLPLPLLLIFVPLAVILAIIPYIGVIVSSPIIVLSTLITFVLSWGSIILALVNVIMASVYMQKHGKLNGKANFGFILSIIVLALTALDILFSILLSVLGIVLIVPAFVILLLISLLMPII